MRHLLRRSPRRRWIADSATPLSIVIAQVLSQLNLLLQPSYGLANRLVCEVRGEMCVISISESLAGDISDSAAGSPSRLRRCLPP